MIRKLDPEQPQESPRKPEAEQPNLTTVGVPGQDQICFALRQVFERARIMQHDDAGGSGNARMLLTDSLHSLRSVVPGKVHSDDVNAASLGIDQRSIIDQQDDSVGGQGLTDCLWRFVIVVAMTSKDATFQRCQWLQ